MKRNILFSAMALLTGSLIAADSSPKDDVKNATKKLADAGGYSWKTSSDFGGGGGGGGGGGAFRPGPTEGKVGKDGIALISMTRGENTTQAVIKGEKRAVKTEEGWRSLDELAGGGGGGGGGGRGGRGAAFGVRNVKLPAVEAEELLGKVKEIKSADGALVGDLTEEGAKSLMAFGGRRGGGGGGGGPDISNAKGSVKFWVKDGVLSKYQYNVKGTISFGGNDRDTDRTTTVEIKDVGSTSVEIPEDAKKKVS